MGMYSVMADDGETYGPVDEDSLAEWAREGRINVRTVLQCQDTGMRMTAGVLPTVAPFVVGLPPEMVNALAAPSPQAPAPPPERHPPSVPSATTYHGPVATASANVLVNNVAQPVSPRGVIIASWVLILLACGLAIVPFLGFASWVIAGPVFLVTFILAIVAMTRGGVASGICILLMSLIVGPIFVAVAPFISSTLGLAGAGAAAASYAEANQPSHAAPPRSATPGDKGDPEDYLRRFLGSWRLRSYAPAGRNWGPANWGEEVLDISEGGRYQINDGTPGSWHLDPESGSLKLTDGASRNVVRLHDDGLELTDRTGGRYIYVRVISE